jgi:single-stranded-DNA-specific exonuclease
VLSDDSWHPGVIGIVASRLVEQFHCPTVLIALDGDVGRGSARSIPSYHIYEALGMCEEKLLNYGGHAAAAGLEILREDIESFHMLLLQDAEKKLSAQDLKPKLFIDAKISLEEISFDLLDQIAKLAPNGSGNPLPLFAAEDVTTAGQAQMMGSSGKHVSFRVQSGKTIVRAIAFNYAHILDSISNHGTRISIAFRPHVSSYSGRIELDVKDIRLC